MSTEQTPPAAETEAAQGPGVGVDEWVARSAGRREYAPGRVGQAQRLFERVPWWVDSAGGRARRSVRPIADHERLPAADRDQRPAAGDPGRRAEHLGGLGGPARPRLRRVLRLRRLRLRAGVVKPAQSADRHPLVHVHLGSDRDDRRGGSSALAVGWPSRRLDRRLPGDRHAVLRRGVRRVHQQRRPQQARRPQRDRQHRPVQGLRNHDPHQQGVLLRPARAAGADGRCPALVRHLSHRTRMARGA